MLTTGSPPKADRCRPLPGARDLAILAFSRPIPAELPYLLTSRVRSPGWVHARPGPARPGVQAKASQSSAPGHPSRPTPPGCALWWTRVKRTGASRLIIDLGRHGPCGTAPSERPRAWTGADAGSEFASRDRGSWPVVPMRQGRLRDGRRYHGSLLPGCADVSGLIPISQDCGHDLTRCCCVRSCCWRDGLEPVWRC